MSKPVVLIAKSCLLPPSEAWDPTSRSGRATEPTATSCSRPRRSPRCDPVRHQDGLRAIGAGKKAQGHRPRGCRARQRRRAGSHPGRCHGRQRADLQHPSAAELAVGLLLDPRGTSPLPTRRSRGAREAEETAVSSCSTRRSASSASAGSALVAERLEGFGMKILAYDPCAAPPRRAGSAPISWGSTSCSPSPTSSRSTCPRRPETLSLIGDDTARARSAVGADRQRRPRRLVDEAALAGARSPRAGRRRRHRRLRHRAHRPSRRSSSTSPSSSRRTSAPRPTRPRRRPASRSRRVDDASRSVVRCAPTPSTSGGDPPRRCPPGHPLSGSWPGFTAVAGGVLARSTSTSPVRSPPTTSACGAGRPQGPVHRRRRGRRELGQRPGARRAARPARAPRHRPRLGQLPQRRRPARHAATAPSSPSTAR